MEDLVLGKLAVLVEEDPVLGELTVLVVEDPVLGKLAVLVVEDPVLGELAVLVQSVMSWEHADCVEGGLMGQPRVNAQLTGTTTQQIIPSGTNL